jgi:hypothetical protein
MNTFGLCQLKFSQNRNTIHGGGCPAMQPYSGRYPLTKVKKADILYEKNLTEQD